MKTFFGEELFVSSKSAKAIYEEVKDLPIIDYHCHLDQNKIAQDSGFSDIGELWLADDHYKWRAMRLCGVEEEYITGKASYKEKFLKYAEILPKTVGNALYYWTHMELAQIFGIHEPLNKESAERIYAQANEKLKNITVSSLLKQYAVEYIATTDDPVDDLNAHGRYGFTQVSPTFRPDKIYALDGEYLDKLGVVAGVEICTLSTLLTALEKRLDYFVSKGCKIPTTVLRRFQKRMRTKKKRKNISKEKKVCPQRKKISFLGICSYGLPSSTPSGI